MPEVKSKSEEVHSRIAELESELAKTKYNKRTQHHVGLVKAKIAQLKERQQRRSAGKGKTEGFTVKKSGDASVILVGFPSVGKSTLLNRITNAKSAVAQYAFTTLTCIPGTMYYEGAKIQILDVPGIIEGAASGRGRGKEVLSVTSSADLAILLVDIFTAGSVDKIKKEIYDSSIRLNQRPPDVTIKKTAHGGVSIGTTVQLTYLDKPTIVDMLKEFRIMNADIVIREDITPDQLIDVVEGNKKYMPGIVVVNKIDMASAEEIEGIKQDISPDIMISAEKNISVEELKLMIFSKLGLMRIYCKEIGKKADLEEPLIVFRGCTLGDMCRKLHKDFVSKFRFARLWGSSVKFGGQMIRRLDHTLKEGDIVELHIT
ncbi:GTP-binding protein [Candidatus Woesearchaeota archaeon]|nr:GTP-binding protein [Candidatus Woesearchaeota archaeon]